jgi:hypothetical protein
MFSTRKAREIMGGMQVFLQGDRRKIFSINQQFDSTILPPGQNAAEYLSSTGLQNEGGKSQKQFDPDTDTDPDPEKRAFQSLLNKHGAFAEFEATG